MVRFTGKASNLLFALLIAILFTGHARSQEQQTSSASAENESQELDQLKTRVLGLLQSNDGKEQAWGAYLTGKHHLSENAGLVASLLSPPEAAQAQPNPLVLSAALDSLIQMEASVPSETLVLVYAAFPSQAIILMAKSPRDHAEGLLGLMQKQSSGVRWVAICNLLAEIKEPRFAAQLLKDLQIHAAITVHDANSGCGRGGSSGCFGSSISRPATAPSGYPPMTNYILIESAPRGAVVAAPGAHPVYYERRAGVQAAPIETNYAIGDPDGRRVEYIAALLDTGVKALNFEHRPVYDLVWRGAKNFEARTKAIRAEIGQSYKQVLDSLIGKNLLTEAEAAALEPQISLDIHDCRSDTAVALTSQ